MPRRVRTKQIGRFEPGRIIWHSIGVTYAGAPNLVPVLLYSEDESSGRGKENDFFLRRTVTDIKPMNGQYIEPGGKLNTTYQDYVPTYASSLLEPGSPPNSPSFHVPKVLSGSNPSRAFVDVGTFTGELRDLPGMFKGIWDSAKPIYRELNRNRSVRERLDRAFKEAAKQTFGKPDSRFIEYQFGWAPFVSDIEKYLKSGRIIEKRYEELYRLKMSGVSSRRIRLDSGNVQQPPERTLISSQRGLIYGMVSRAQSFEQWGVGKWYLDPNGRLARADSIAKIERLAKESVQGLALDQSTAWNLMPWSWLIDWASNVGDWIESSRNIVGASRAPTVAIMTYSNGLIHCDRQPALDEWPEMSGGSFTRLVETKARSILGSTNLPELTVPILSHSQSAILSSLMTMRARRS